MKLAAFFSRIFMSLFFTLNTLSVICQVQKQQKHALYFELGGSGGLGSFNYERHFSQKKSWELTWSAGISLAPIDKNNGTGIVIPIMLHANLGKKAVKLELGIGQGLTVTTKGSVFTLTTLAIGPRFQTAGSPWYYRATFTPLISYLVDFQVQPWGGISIGYAFKDNTP
jgi:hypothetical protein